MCDNVNVGVDVLHVKKKNQGKLDFSCHDPFRFCLYSIFNHGVYHKASFQKSRYRFISDEFKPEVTVARMNLRNKP